MKKESVTKKILIIILLASFIIFGGQCAAQKKGTTEGPFVSGTKGVEIKFDIEGGAPPEQFDVTDTVPLRVILKNNGEYGIPAGEAKVKIEGILLSAFGLPESYKATTGALKGISKFITEGQEQRIDIGNINYKEKIIGEQEFTLVGKVCYPYETNAQLKICMGKRTNPDKICTLTGEKLISGSVSSSPIQITSVTQESYGTNKILLKINIENKGAGDSYSINSACESIKPTTEKNIINLELNEGIKCSFLEGESNKGQLKLSTAKTGKTTTLSKLLTCEAVAEETGSNYEQQLNIKLSNKYVDRTSTKVKIIGTG